MAGVVDEFSAQAVSLAVLEHLERRRDQIVGDEERVRAEVAAALEPVHEAYREAELPAAYFEALEREIVQVVPDAWRAVAAPYTTGEKRDFGIWRGGDPVARIAYVFLGLLVGGLCVALPFIPIWEKWFPFALAVGGWWLPTAQLGFHRRRYARALGQIVQRMSQLQPALEGRITMESLLLGDSDKRE
jgi:hypothetical protein